ncbi:urea transport system permease protein [Aequitasia blattaphilus]|uniref:Urea ABC transporter permease subunit UrtB n=1 Tax=Aequitasia blattaphilus TaxID=2949332 RepID=A0ABT1E8V8_9FIRM|nr:urea ABC transporter permease subunit UrtB [Aequitasia blattaphilus]MCP1102250.1 urea ABC transporter permease subunit UrtB [Aequitasia blattaphilus]MCR8614890.1 urea ABC transporter permease subunit UrtB [Aequitasia blattaphilus]
MAQFINTAFNGLSLSSIILLTSLGLAITFGLMRVINMAHGEFLMIGAYITYVVQTIFEKVFPDSLFSIYYFLALIVAFGVTFLLGMLMEKFIISRLYGREVDSLLATWGVSIILQQAARSVFGMQGVNVKAPSFLNGGMTVGRCTFSYNRLFIIGLVILCMILVWYIMYKSNFGKQMRAVMQNRSMAQCMGINSREVDTLTFAFGSGLAGLAGCSVALLGSIDSTIGQSYIVNSFIAVVLGGVGKLIGTVFGSSIIGFANIGIENYTSASIAKAAVLLLVIIVLQFRPQGLFAIKSRKLDE